MDASEAVQWFFFGVSSTSVCLACVAWLVGARKGRW